MFTRILCAAALCGVAVFTQPQIVQAQTIRVMLNGEPVRFETTGPIQRNGRVLVPLRGVLEQMGAYVDWNAGTQTVIASKDNLTIELPIGSYYATVNGDRVRLDVPAMTYFGSTMVPLRFISESLGADVDWNSGAYTVMIESRRPGFAYRRDRAHYSPPERYYPPSRDRRPEVVSVSTDWPGGILRPGEEFHVKMRATAGGTGYFRIRGVVGERKMTETSPGIYEVTWINRTDMDQRVPLSEILCYVLVGDIATNEMHP